MNANQTNVALIGGFGLGDTLIQMVLANNAAQAGCRVTIFSRFLNQLAGWFPAHRIVPEPAPDQLEDTLVPFDRVFSHRQVPTGASQRLQSRWVAYENEFLPRTTRVQNMVHISRRHFDLTDPSSTCGIRPPGKLDWRGHPRRVAIHPTSAEIAKNWPPGKFLRLADVLTSRGYDVRFIMSAREQPQWAPVIGDRYDLAGFASLDACARFIYESGFFIGNDSGGGHLAASLHIPTLSLHGRKGKSRLWRPDWGTVEVVTPAVNLVGGALRQRCWHHFMSVSRVARAFGRLKTRATGIASPFPSS